MDKMPVWSQCDHKSFIKKIIDEIQILQESFPESGFKMMQESDGTVFASGTAFIQNNGYTVRLYYPDDYPYSHLIPVIMDKSVIDQCTSRNLNSAFYYGLHKGGLNIDLKNSDSRQALAIDRYVEGILVWLYFFEHNIKTMQLKEKDHGIY